MTSSSVISEPPAEVAADYRAVQQEERVGARANPDVQTRPEDVVTRQLYPIEETTTLRLWRPCAEPQWIAIRVEAVERVPVVAYQAEVRWRGVRPVEPVADLAF